MKKKITLTLLVLVCTLCCAFSLAACNNGGDTVAVTSITLNKTELTLEIGGEETLTPTVKPDNATNKTVTWSSSDPAIATIANGKVTAISAGAATIIATADGKSATCTVTVNAAMPSTIAGTYYVIEQSETGWVSAQYIAAIFNNDGTCNIGGAGTYKIEDGIIAVSLGSTTYYAVLDGKILWMFENKEDTDDMSKSIEYFYNGIEISVEDRAKIVAVFGDGITNGENK